MWWVRESSDAALRDALRLLLLEKTIHARDPLPERICSH